MAGVQSLRQGLLGASASVGVDATEAVGDAVRVAVAVRWPRAAALHPTITSKQERQSSEEEDARIGLPFPSKNRLALARFA